MYARRLLQHTSVGRGRPLFKRDSPSYFFCPSYQRVRLPSLPTFRYGTGRVPSEAILHALDCCAASLSTRAGFGRGRPHVRHGVRVPDAVYRGADQARPPDSDVQRHLQETGPGTTYRTAHRSAIENRYSAADAYLHVHGEIILAQLLPSLEIVFTDDVCCALHNACGVCRLFVIAACPCIFWGGGRGRRG